MDEEGKLVSLWNEFRGLSTNTYAKEIWQPLSEHMGGRNPDACHQKAYRMGLLGDNGSNSKRPKIREPSRRRPVNHPSGVTVDRNQVLTSQGKVGPNRIVSAANGLAQTKHPGNGIMGEASVTRKVPQDSNAWKHDRSNVKGRIWRRKRHEGLKKWRVGVHHSNLENFCSPDCESCAEERRSRWQIPS